MFLSLFAVLALQDVPTLSTEGVRDRTGDGVAFVEVLAPDRAPWAEAPFTLVLRIGVEQAFIESGLIQLFRRQLDLPVQLQASWLDELPGAESRAPVEPGAPGTTSIAVNGEIVRVHGAGHVERDGRRYRLVELSRQYTPGSAGRIEVPRAHLHFAYATRFREDFVNGLVPEDRLDAFVVSAPLALEVRELPLTDQPPGFAGAIGRFTVDATAEPRDLAVGERLVLTLTIEGEGNLEQLRAPSLSRLRDLTLLGSEDDFVEGRRTIRYDLEVRAERLREIPAVGLAFFDPEAESYVEVDTKPISILVRPAPAEPAAPAAPTGPEAQAPKAQEAVAPLGLLAVPALLLAVGAFAGVVVYRRARRRASGGRDERLGAAREAFASSTKGDAAEAFAQFLATLLDCDAASVSAHGLEQRLVGAGLDGSQARRSARLFERLQAPRYGGPPVTEAAAQAEALVREIASD